MLHAIPRADSSGRQTPPTRYCLPCRHAQPCYIVTRATPLEGHLINRHRKQVSTVCIPTHDPGSLQTYCTPEYPSCDASSFQVSHLGQSWLGVCTNVETRTVHYGTECSSVGCLGPIMARMWKSGRCTMELTVPVWDVGNDAIWNWEPPESVVSVGKCI